MEKELKKIMDKHDLNSRMDLFSFIIDNPENLSINNLLRISELVNTKRIETAAFYTDFMTLKTIENYLPEINKDIIRIKEEINKYNEGKLYSERIVMTIKRLQKLLYFREKTSILR